MKQKNMLEYHNNNRKNRNFKNNAILYVKGNRRRKDASAYVKHVVKEDLKNTIKTTKDKIIHKDSIRTNKHQINLMKLNPLYKLTREILFDKDYRCKFCGMTDFDKYYMKNHVKEYHDENSKELKLFMCKKCYKSMIEMEIFTHECNFKQKV